MQLGRLRDQIEIHVPTLGTDEVGAPTQDYTAAGRAKTIRIMAQKMPARRLEEMDRSREVPQNLTRLAIIFRNDFDESARILFRSRLYDVKGIDDAPGLRKFLILTLTLRIEDQNT